MSDEQEMPKSAQIEHGHNPDNPDDHAVRVTVGGLAYDEAEHIANKIVDLLQGQWSNIEIDRGEDNDG